MPLDNIDNPIVLMAESQITTLKRDMHQRLDAVVRLPTIMGNYCPIAITDFQLAGRNDSIMFRLLGGIANPLVIDIQHVNKSIQDYMSASSYGYYKFAPPIVVPLAVNDLSLQVKHFCGDHILQM